MTFLALLAVIAIQLTKTVKILAEKIEPSMNYQGLSTFIRLTNACSKGCWRLDTKFFFHDSLAMAPYFDGLL